MQQLTYPDNQSSLPVADGQASSELALKPAVDGVDCKSGSVGDDWPSSTCCRCCCFRGMLSCWAGCLVLDLKVGRGAENRDRARRSAPPPAGPVVSLARCERADIEWFGTSGMECLAGPS